MKLSCLFLLCLAHIVLAHRGFRRRSNEDSGESRHCDSPKCISFPECEEYVQKLRDELKRLEESSSAGPSVCEDGNPQQCMFNDWLKAAKKVNDVPSYDCWNQIDMIYKQNTNGRETET